MSLFLTTQKSKGAFNENIRQQLLSTQRMYVINLIKLYNQSTQITCDFQKGKVTESIHGRKVPTVKYNSLDTTPEPLFTQRRISWNKSYTSYLVLIFFSCLLPSANGNMMLGYMELWSDPSH